MCLTCIGEINQAFSFKQKSERSEVTLRSLLPSIDSIEEFMKNENPSQIIDEVNGIHISDDDTAADDAQQNEMKCVDEQMSEQECEEVAIEEIHSPAAEQPEVNKASLCMHLKFI